MKYLRFVLRCLPLAALGLLTACATGIAPQASLEPARRDLAGINLQPLQIQQEALDKAGQERSAQLLAQEVDQQAALELAMLHSANLQALLATAWADAQQVRQQALPGNPLLRWQRSRHGAELEIERGIVLSLFEWLTLPARQRQADLRLQGVQVRQSMQLLAELTRIKQAWVQAVAAQEQHAYALQVLQSAQAAADLAARMQAVGNLNRLERNLQHSMYAEAAAELSKSRNRQQAARENLLRLLGLSTEQAEKLRLPQRLPALPTQIISTGKVQEMSLNQRLDIRLAKAQLDAALQEQGLSLPGNWLQFELEAGRSRSSEKEGATQILGLEWHLPLFSKTGDLSARSLAARHQLQAALTNAASHLRQSYFAYQSAHEQALLHSREILPARVRIAEEKQKMYNGMLISVFDLLADYRQRMNAVQANIAASEQFWLQEAQMQAQMLGLNMSAPESGPAPASGQAEAQH